MALIPITLRPGVNTEETRNLNEGGWTESACIRFRQGLAEKDGGFVEFCQTLVGAGAPQALQAWTALSQVSYLAIACAMQLDLFSAGVVYNITPSTISSYIPLSLSTTAGSNTVVITDAGNMPVMGEWLQIRDPVTVSTILLLGSYEVIATGSGNYSIAASNNALQTLNHVGYVRQFTSVIGSDFIQIYLPNHGLFQGQTVSIPDVTTVGGVPLQGNYSAIVIDQNNYEVLAASPATSAQTLNENARGMPGASTGPGNLQLTFLNPASGGTQAGLNVVNSTLANWGEFLMWNPQGGPVYVWMPQTGTSTPAAVATGSTPLSSTAIFVATQEQMLFCLGTVNMATGLVDPMLIGWSDAGDYTDFIPSTTNQAGSFRLTAGSKLVAGLPLAGGNLYWTDLALYQAAYLGLPLIWGFQPQGINCGLVGPHAFGTVVQTVFWMSQQQFYSWQGGAPSIIPCTVWDVVFKKIDKANISKVVCETNSFSNNEVSWEVPQLGGTVTRARLQIDTGIWDYTTLPNGNFAPRTAWIDQSVFGPPLAADAVTGIVWQQETGKDAGTQPLLWRLKSGFVDLAEGDQIVQVNGLYPDFKFTADGSPGPGTVEMLVYAFAYSQQAPRVKGPFPINAQTRFVPCRTRARALQFEFRGRDLGSSVRLGKIEYRGAPDGRRP